MCKCVSTRITEVVVFLEDLTQIAPVLQMIFLSQLLYLLQLHNYLNLSRNYKKAAIFINAMMFTVNIMK